MIVRLTELGAAGFVGDIPAHDLPERPLAWSGVRNMGFRAGLAERAEGYKRGFDLTPTHMSLGLITATKVDGTPFLVSACASKFFSYTSTSEYDCTGSTTPAATADTKWTLSTFTGFVIANNSVNNPYYIPIANLDTGSFANLTNWPANTLCKTLRPYKYFLVAANMTESGTDLPFKVRWSSSAVPGALPATWVASATNNAGSVDLSADDGPIVDMLGFGDALAIYRSSGITLMRFTGGSEVMSFVRVPSASGGGLIGNNCVCDVPGIGHVAMSLSDIYVFDGNVIRSVIDNRVRKWFLENINQTYGHRSFVVHHATKSEVWCCFPEIGETSCTKAIMWNYAANTVGIRDLPNCTAGENGVVRTADPTTWNTVAGTWNGLSGTWQSYAVAPLARKTFLASTDNRLYAIGDAHDADGSALVGQLERTGIALGDAQRVKYVRSVWPRIDAPAGQAIEISVGMQMSVDEAVTWKPAKIYTVGTSRKVDVNLAGRFMALRIRSPSGHPWRIQSLDVDIEPRGLW